jgi:hypothetical protein
MACQGFCGKYMYTYVTLAQSTSSARCRLANGQAQSRPAERNNSEQSNQVICSESSYSPAEERLMKTTPSKKMLFVASFVNQLIFSQVIFSYFLQRSPNYVENDKTDLSGILQHKINTRRNYQGLTLSSYRCGTPLTTFCLDTYVSS